CFELRSWKTKYRGPLVIHAAMKIDAEDARQLGLNPEKLITSAFVGVAILSDVRPYTREDANLLKKRRSGFGWFPHNFSWVLKKPRRISPVKAKGQLSLFKVPKAVERRIRKVMSAAARAKISKATKARWARFRAAKAKGKHQSLLENGCKRPRKISRKSNREAARYYSYGVTLKSNRVRARGLLLFPATYCQSQSPGWTATFPQNADRLGWRGKDGLNSRLRRMCACRDLG